MTSPVPWMTSLPRAGSAGEEVGPTEGDWVAALGAALFELPPDGLGPRWAAADLSSPVIRRTEIREVARTTAGTTIHAAWMRGRLR